METALKFAVARNLHFVCALHKHTYHSSLGGSRCLLRESRDMSTKRLSGAEVRRTRRAAASCGSSWPQGCAPFGQLQQMY